VIFTTTIIVRSKTRAKKIRIGAGEGSNKIASGVGSCRANGAGSASKKSENTITVPEKTHIGVLRAIS